MYIYIYILRHTLYTLLRLCLGFANVRTRNRRVASERPGSDGVSFERATRSNCCIIVIVIVITCIIIIIIITIIIIRSSSSSSSSSNKYIIVLIINNYY